MDHKIKVTASPYRRYAKPNMINEWDVLSHHTEPYFISTTDFADKVGNRGHSFSHAVCGGNGEINTSNFLESNLLVLDLSLIHI